MPLPFTKIFGCSRGLEPKGVTASPFSQKTACRVRGTFMSGNRSSSILTKGMESGTAAMTDAKVCMKTAKIMLKAYWRRHMRIR